MTPLVLYMQRKMKQRSKKPSKRLKGDSPERYYKHQPHTQTNTRESRRDSVSLYLVPNMFLLHLMKRKEAEKMLYVKRSVHLVDKSRTETCQLRCLGGFLSL